MPTRPKPPTARVVRRRANLKLLFLVYDMLDAEGFAWCDPHRPWADCPRATAAAYRYELGQALMARMATEPWYATATPAERDAHFWQRFPVVIQEHPDVSTVWPPPTTREGQRVFDFVVTDAETENERSGIDLDGVTASARQQTTVRRAPQSRDGQRTWRVLPLQPATPPARRYTPPRPRVYTQADLGLTPPAAGDGLC